MEYAEGMVVRSIAGRDAGGWFVVMQVENGFCHIADGRRRSIAVPKKKNPLHLRKTSYTLDLAQIGSDRQLKRLLAQLGPDTGESEDGR